jgi:hypothetical protein
MGWTGGGWGAAVLHAVRARWVYWLWEGFATWQYMATHGNTWQFTYATCCYSPPLPSPPLPPPPPLPPGPYKDLARQCWDADPQKRPSFRTIVQQLEAVISQSVGDACSCVQELF